METARLIEGPDPERALILLERAVAATKNKEVGATHFAAFNFPVVEYEGATSSLHMVNFGRVNTDAQQGHKQTQQVQGPNSSLQQLFMNRTALGKSGGTYKHSYLKHSLPMSLIALADYHRDIVLDSVGADELCRLAEASDPHFPSSLRHSTWAERCMMCASLSSSFN